MIETLQDKIDSIAYELQNTPNADEGLTKRLVDKAIQELREEIMDEARQYDEVTRIAIRPFLNEVLSLIGEKK